MAFPTGRGATKGQVQTMIGILALGDQACGANIRSLHYRHIVSGHVGQTTVYHQVKKLTDRHWLQKRKGRPVMIGTERFGNGPVYRLTEAGRRALVMYFADTLWLSALDRQAHGEIMHEAQRIIDRAVARARRGVVQMTKERKAA